MYHDKWRAARIQAVHTAKADIVARLQAPSPGKPHSAVKGIAAAQTSSTGPSYLQIGDLWLSPKYLETSESDTVRIAVYRSVMLLLGMKPAKGDISKVCLTVEALIKDWANLSAARARGNVLPNNDRPR